MPTGGRFCTFVLLLTGGAHQQDSGAVYTPPPIQGASEDNLHFAHAS